MKKLLIASAMLVSLGAFAQSPGNEPSVKTDRSLIRFDPDRILRLEPGDQIVGQRFTYSGIGVQLVKADNPLQLVNPLAGDKYGDPENNTVREPKTERAIGWKLFGLQF